MVRATLGILLCAAAAAAQVTTGRLTGSVTDPQGGAVPGAQITVSEPQIGRTFSTTTNERGDWAIPSVPPAQYRVSATAPGFKTTVIEDVVVEAGLPSTVNITLELGAVVETVEVEGGAEVLQTTTATVSSTLTGRQINELPFVTRNVLELIVTQPGTQTPGTPRTSSINGLPKGSMNITLDGINIQDNLLRSDDAFFATMQPKTDAVAEVTVQTAALGAESSGEGAAQIKFITKSGTNNFRGGVFWQHRNTALNANYYFNNIDRLSRDRIILNQFGGRVGGPILRNRLFFFASHEEFHLPQTYNSTRLTLMTDHARRGIFRYRDATGRIRDVDLFGLAAAANPRLPSNVRAFPTTADPALAAIFNETARLATPQTGNLADRIGSNNDYNRNFFNFQIPGDNVRRFSTLRLDANVTSRHQIEFVYNYQYYNSNPDAVNSVFPILPGTGTVLGHPASGGIRRNAFSAVAALRSTLTPRLASEVRFGMRSGTSLFRESITPTLFEQWRGYATITSDYVSNPYTARTQSRRNTPIWQGNANLTWTQGPHLWNFGGSFTQVNSWVVSTATETTPTVTFGFAQGDPVNTGATSLFTTTNFPDSTAGQRTDAANLYTVLTGRVRSFGRAVNIDEETRNYGPTGLVERARQREFALYFQDSWKVRPGLTFNYGLRWDVQLPFTNTSQTYTRVGLEGLYGVSGVGNTFAPGVLTGAPPAFFPVTSEDHAYKTFWKNLSPSVGFAWSVPGPAPGPLGWLLGSNGASVIRAGYSIATIREGMNTFQDMWGANQGPAVTLNLTPATFPEIFGAAGSVLFRDPNLPARPAPARPTYPLPAVAGVTVNDFDPNLRPGYVQSWTFGIQREITKNTVVDFRYVGNHGTALWRQINLNETNVFENGFLEEFKIAMNNLATARGMNPSSTNFGNQGLPGQRNIPIIATALGLTSDTAFATTVSRGEAGRLANNIATDATRLARLVAAGWPANFFRVNPTILGSGSFLMANLGNSTYNAFQVEVRRRMWRGVQMQGSYAWSKSLSNMLGSSTAVLDQPTTIRNTRLDKGPSPWDIRHGFKLNWIYELPFGLSRRFANGGGPVVRKLLEGWEIAGVSRIQSGSPDFLRSDRQTFNAATGTDTTADAGVILHNLTPKQFRGMVQDPQGPQRRRVLSAVVTDPEFASRFRGRRPQPVTTRSQCTLHRPAYGAGAARLPCVHLRALAVAVGPEPDQENQNSRDERPGITRAVHQRFQHDEFSAGRSGKRGEYGIGGCCFWPNPQRLPRHIGFRNE